MRPFARYMKEKYKYRVLSYVDDFLIVPSPPRLMANADDIELAQKLIPRLMRRVGLVRKFGKGQWNGGKAIDHLGMHRETNDMKVYVSASKVMRVRKLSQKLLKRVQLNRRLIPTHTIRQFCGVCISPSLPFLLTRFYTRSLYFDLCRREHAKRAQSPPQREKGGLDDFARSDARDAAV